MNPSTFNNPSVTLIFDIKEKPESSFADKMLVVNYLLRTGRGLTLSERPSGSMQKNCYILNYPSFKVTHNEQASP